MPKAHGTLEPEPAAAAAAAAFAAWAASCGGTIPVQTITSIKNRLCALRKTEGSLLLHREALLL